VPSLSNAKIRVAFLLGWLRITALIHAFVDRYGCKKSSSGKLLFPYVKKRRSASIQILAYHRINDEHDPFFPGIPTEVFARQMEYLASHFSVWPLSDLIEGVQKRDVPGNAVAITFDDGYRDNYLNAFPILQQLSLPATVFLATEAIGSKKRLWHDRVFSGFRNSQVSYLEDFPSSLHRLSLGSLDEKLAAQKAALLFIWSKTEEDREFWIGQLLDKLRVPDQKDEAGLMLSWSEIVAMHREGISFGSHTVTHPILSKLSEERMKREIVDSKTEIETRLGERVTTFAYPIGRREDFDERSKTLLRTAGYHCAVTSELGSNEADQDVLELRRIMPWAEDPYTFGLRLNYYKFAY
jgi:peptidoglycan/xylan/chitin deacetylase (PgdA/CDA1 family)